MTYFIEIDPSNNRPGTTLVGRSGNRVASRLLHNELQLKQVEPDRGFTTEYKLSLLERLTNAEFFSCE